MSNCHIKAIIGLYESFLYSYFAILSTIDFNSSMIGNFQSLNPTKFKLSQYLCAYSHFPA